MLVIKNATIYTSSHLGVLENHDILIQDGKIIEIGKNIDAKDYEVLDATGLTVTPGLVDAHSHVGGFGVGSKSPDLNEMSNPSTPEVEAINGTDIESPDFKRVLEAGITTNLICPGSGNVVCGTAFILKTYGKSLKEMVLKNQVAMKVALGGNPKGVYGSKGQLPVTRMGIAHVIRETLIKGREYLEEKNSSKDYKYDIGMEHIARVLTKEIPLKVHCEQFDILTVIRIAKEFDVDFTIEHGWGASNFIDEIACSGIKGMNFGPIGVHMTPGECGIVDIESVLELDRRGVMCSLITDGPLETPHSLILQAGELVRFGADVEKAIRMITINPAKIIGVEDRVGSIEVGKDADLVVFKGTPTMDTGARVKYTIVNGKFAYRD